MTFGKAGTYTYVCVLHAPQGMVGTVVVEAQTAPLPPNTGSGTVTGGHSTTLWLAVVGLVVIALGGSSIATARRRG